MTFRDHLLGFLTVLAFIAVIAAGSALETALFG